MDDPTLTEAQERSIRLAALAHHARKRHDRIRRESRDAAEHARAGIIAEAAASRARIAHAEFLRRAFGGS
jgi:hypothetical protein